MTNDQKNFWSGKFGEEYINRNSDYDVRLTDKAWRTMLEKADKSSLNSILECGANIGRNLTALQKQYPTAAMSLIEVNKKAYDQAVVSVRPTQAVNCTIMESSLRENAFDLVFTVGVLIHIAPYDLYRSMQKMYAYSNKYILVAEYFSKKLEMILYHGETNKLFKMDYGSYFMDNFDVELVDYGFLWGREYDAAGFDDINWWLFKKK